MRTSQEDKKKRDGSTGTVRSFSFNMQKKLAITLVVILLALFALLYRIYALQHENLDSYNQKVLSQQRYDSRDIPYRRGDILDRNGTYIATSNKVYNLIIDPSQINSDQDNYLEPTISLLSEVFGYDRAELRELIIDKSDSQYIRYDKQLSADKKEEFEARTTEINNAYKKDGDKQRVYGVWFEDSYLRTYPYGSLACSVIGFARSDGDEGTGGIEQYYNSSLIGTAGREYGYLNDDSNLERVIKSAQNGNTIVSTIDVNIQTIVEKYIKQWEDEAGSKITACIVMDPNNGEILAMATSNSFDLNNPRDLTGHYTQEEIDAMDDEAKSEAWNKLWRNFCVSDTYEPGSPSKIFTVAAALEEGVINGSESFVCDGYQEVGGWKIRCVKRTGHGTLTVEEGLMQSCNDVMMQIASKIGISNFSKFMQMFGFGGKTDIDLPGEADTSTLIHSESSMVPTDLATNSFGQNYNCTMIQMAAAYASVINGGSYYKPHVVKQILNEQGAVVESIEPELVRETVSQSTTSFINNALLRTVNEGTGAAAKIEGYDIAGKTGTAEKYPRGTGNYLVSFCGYAPAQNPEVLCYVIIDQPNVESQAHSSYASNIFKNIMTEVLPYMNIFPAGDYGVIEDMETKTEAETLPEGEGITDNAAENELKPQIVYDTEETVEQSTDGEDAENLPGIPAGVTEAQAESQGASQGGSTVGVSSNYDTDETVEAGTKAETKKETKSETKAETKSETKSQTKAETRQETTATPETQPQTTAEETVAPAPIN